MPVKWRDIETEIMLDYRDRGVTEAKIAARMSVIFMRKFTEQSVNRRIRTLKDLGYLERNPRTGRFRNMYGIKRDGENYAKNGKIKLGSKIISGPIKHPEKKGKKP